MKKVIAFTLVAVMALAMLVSCGGSKNDILGKWKGEEAGVEAVYEFKNDGTVEITAMGFTMTGTYKVEGDTLTMGIEMMGVNDESTAKFKIEGDTLTISEDGGDETITMTRVKD
ncbi:MAG: hypothetical protein IJL41_05110 [Clostridia bacterium]|nr:hypothetical protein [Clostridia bacterium]